VRELIEDKDRTKEISETIAKSYLSWGMQTFDQSLMFLFKNRSITYEEALRQASNKDDFALRVRGVSTSGDTKWEGFDSGQGGPDQQNNEIL
jgi:twitching motility protein PilT